MCYRHGTYKIIAYIKWHKSHQVQAELKKAIATDVTTHAVMNIKISQEVSSRVNYLFYLFSSPPRMEKIQYKNTSTNGVIQ